MTGNLYMEIGFEITIEIQNRVVHNNYLFTCRCKDGKMRIVYGYYMNETMYIIYPF